MCELYLFGYLQNRYLTRQQDLEEGVMSELIISDIGRDDGGIYSCRASNMFGIDQTSVLLNVQGKL